VSGRVRAVFFLILVNILWGLSFPIGKALNLQLDQLVDGRVDLQSMTFRVAAATWIVGLRFTVAFALFFIFFRLIFKHAGFREWLAGSVIGGFFLIGLILQLIGLATIPASRSGFLTSLTVVFVPFFGALLHGHRPSWSVCSGIVVSLVGVAFLTGLIGWSDKGLELAADGLSAWTIGDSLTVVSTLFFTCQILSIDRLAKRLRASSFTPGMFLVVSLGGWLIHFGTLPFIPGIQVSEGLFQATSTYSFALLILTLAGFPSLLSFSWMNTYQPQVTPTQAAVIYTTEPVFVTLWAMVLPGIFHSLWGLGMENERLSATIVVGGLLILLANVLALRGELVGKKIP
jgi:drug/metabolite transporter (DMT)-like permease